MTNDFSNGFAQYAKERSSRQLREATLQCYQNATESLIHQGGFDLERLADPGHIRAVIEKLEERKLSSQSLNLYTFVIRLWLEYKGVPISEEITRLLRRRKGPRSRLIHPKDLLTNDDLDDIMRKTRSLSIRAYLWTLYDTGTRPGALCNANLADLKQDSHGYVIDFKKTKTDSSRRPVRLLIPEAISALDQWLAVHPDRLNPSAPLFFNRNNRRYNPQLLTIYLKDYHQSRLGKNLNLYLFRKTRATSLLKEKKLSETEIKVRLGHEKDSQMLGKFYAILDEEDQAKAELHYLGVDTGEEKRPEPVICPSCGAPNVAGSLRCSRCLRPLSETGVLEDQTALVRSLRDSGVLRELISEAVKEALQESHEPRPAQGRKPRK